MRSPRILALVVLVGAVAGGLLLDRAEDRSRGGRVAAELPEARAVDPGVAIPAAAPAGTLSSIWYCAGGTAEDDGVADHSVIIQNPTDTDTGARVTVLGGAILPPPPEPPDEEDEDGEDAEEGEEGEDGATTEGDESVDEADAADDATTTTIGATDDEEEVLPTYEPAVEQVELPARSRVELRLGDVLEAELVGAVIEVEGGQVAVEHTVTGDLGRSTAPCSTTAAESWSFPWGVTSPGTADGEAANRQLLVLMNPFPDDATLDIEFATDAGTRTPGRFDAFVVPARSVRAAYVDQSTRREQLSALVTLRSGRVVADRIQLLSGEHEDDPRRGITLGLGAPAAAEVWAFAEGLVGEGFGQQVVVFNPTEETAEVEVEVRLDDPDEHGFPEPFNLTVPPRRYSSLSLEDEDRVPGDVGHAIVVRSVNGIPVVAERVRWALDPAERRGVSATLGSPVTASTWLFPAGGTSDELDERIALANISIDEPAVVQVAGLDDGRLREPNDLQDIEIEPGGRVEIVVDDHFALDELALVVQSSAPIVAERGLYRVGGLGMSNAVGIPLADGVVVPEALAGTPSTSG